MIHPPLVKAAQESLSQGGYVKSAFLVRGVGSGRGESLKKLARAGPAQAKLKKILAARG